MEEEEASELLGATAVALQLMGLWRGGGGGVAAQAAVAAPTLLVMGSAVLLSGAKLCAEPPAVYEELIAVIFILVASVSWTFKATAFVGQRRRLQALAALLVAGSQNYGDGSGTRAHYRALARRVFIYTQAITAVPIAMWALEPLLSGGQNTPLPAWLPLDLHATPAYELLCTFQAVAVTLSVEASVCLDMFFIVLMIAVAAELHILNDNLESIRLQPVHSLPLKPVDDSAMQSYRNASSLTEKDIPQQYEFYRDSHKSMNAIHGTADAHEVMYCLLVKNIQHHQLILKCIKELETAMTYSIFVLLFLNMVTICTLIISTTVLLQSDSDPTSLYKMVSSLPIVMFQTGLFCIFGQMIIDQSERLPAAAFSSGWLDGDIRLRRALLLLMRRAASPLCIIVGRMYPLSRHTYLQLLNGSYTIFNMMYQVRGRSD
uniref:Odorant receptor n=1 Tax=Locusta migratoria TaxID=7004 RepID=A0A0M3SBM6_LOCMI|nr:odorant receptor 97 [Locusta migratoria]